MIVQILSMFQILKFNDALFVLNRLDPLDGLIISHTLRSTLMNSRPVLSHHLLPFNRLRKRFHRERNSSHMSFGLWLTQNWDLAILIFSKGRSMITQNNILRRMSPNFSIFLSRFPLSSEILLEL